MNKRSVILQGGLALLGLLLAYFTWQRGPELDTGEAFVLDITKSDLDKIRFDDDEMKSFVELSKGKDDNGAFTYVRLSGHDASNVPLPSGHPMIQAKLPERLLRGNESAQALFERFTPLRASRALGVLGAEPLKEFGLDAPKKHIEVTIRGGKRRFGIVPAPPGGTEPYIRDEADGRVYVVAGPILSDLQAASTNLIERRLHPFFLEDTDRLVVSGNGKRKEFVARRNEEMPGIQLAPANRPNEGDQTARNWHDRIWNLFPAEVLGKGEVPEPAPPAVAVKVEYFSRGRPLGWLELARSGKPAQSGATGPTEAFARSEFTVGWVRLNPDALNLLTEGETLLGRP